MNDKFLYFSFSEEEAKEALKSMLKEVAPNREICLCGHPSLHHIVDSERSICASKNLYCPCGQLVPVIVCEDLRFFAKNTRGEGANHALALGIASSHFRNKSITWIVEPVCMKCKRKDVRMRPVAMDMNYVKRQGPSLINVLACHECVI